MSPQENQDPNNPMAPSVPAGTNTQPQNAATQPMVGDPAQPAPAPAPIAPAQAPQTVEQPVSSTVVSSGAGAKSKMPLIAAIVLLVLALSAVGAFVFMQTQGNAENAPATQTQALEEDANMQQELVDEEEPAMPMEYDESFLDVDSVTPETLESDVPDASLF